MLKAEPCWLEQNHASHTKHEVEIKMNQQDRQQTEKDTGAPLFI